MPITCYKTQKWGHHMPPTSNHYLEDLGPMAWLSQLVDHAYPVWPSPCITRPFATPRPNQYMALCTCNQVLAIRALKHQSKVSHIYDRCPLGGKLHPHFVDPSTHLVLHVLILQAAHIPGRFHQCCTYIQKLNESVPHTIF